jgi:hypothetical protein
MTATRELIIVGGVIAALVGCGGGDTLTANSSCQDYVDASREDQLAAAQQVAQDQQVPYSPLAQANVDAKCSVAPDRSLAWATTGRTSAETAANTDETAPTPEPVKLTVDSTCADYAAAAAAAQDEFASRLVHRRDLYGNPDSDNSFYSQTEPEPSELEAESRSLSDYLNTLCGGTGEYAEWTLRQAAQSHGVPLPETSDAPREVSAIPSKAAQRRLQEQNPCVDFDGQSYCGDGAFITCSDRVDAGLAEQCKELGIPYACGCYHGMAENKPGYWSEPE